ncbi:MAG: hypothetical protein WCP06_06125 [Verrucomicrobiota bacterium]
MNQKAKKTNPKRPEAPESKKENEALDVPGLKHLTVWKLGARHGACTHLVTGPSAMNGGKRLREYFRDGEDAIRWAKEKETEVTLVGRELANMDSEPRIDARNANALLREHGIEVSLAELAKRAVAVVLSERTKCLIHLGQYLDQIEPKVREGKSKKRGPVRDVTWKDYRRSLKRLRALGGPETPISAIDVPRILAAEDHLGGRAYNKRVLHYHYFFSFAVAAKQLPENPFEQAYNDKRYEPEIKKEIFSPMETWAFLWAS